MWGRERRLGAGGGSYFGGAAGVRNRRLKRTFLVIRKEVKCAVREWLSQYSDSSFSFPNGGKVLLLLRMAAGARGPAAHWRGASVGSIRYYSRPYERVNARSKDLAKPMANLWIRPIGVPLISDDGIDMNPHSARELALLHAASESLVSDPASERLWRDDMIVSVPLREGLLKTVGEVRQKLA